MFYIFVRKEPGQQILYRPPVSILVQQVRVDQGAKLAVNARSLKQFRPGAVLMTKAQTQCHRPSLRTTADRPLLVLTARV